MKVGTGGLVATVLTLFNPPVAAFLGIASLLATAGIYGHGEFNRRATPLQNSPIIPARIEGQFALIYNYSQEANQVLRVAYVPENKEELKELIEALGDGVTIQDVTFEQVVARGKWDRAMDSEEDPRQLYVQYEVVTNLSSDDQVSQLIETLMKNGIEVPLTGSVLNPFTTLTAHCPISFDNVKEIFGKIVDKDPDIFNLGKTAEDVFDINPAQELLVSEYLTRSAYGRRPSALNALMGAYEFRVELFFDGVQDVSTKGYRHQMATV